jgi:long-subunit fatty acid transport protein
VNTAPVYADSTIDTLGASFLSFVYPRGRWAVAGYRHELVKLRDAFETDGVFQEVRNAAGTLTVRELPMLARRDVDIVNYGFSTGVRVNDRLAVGAGISIYTLKLDSSFRRFATTGDQFGPANLDVEAFRTEHVGDDAAVAFSTGVLLNVTDDIRIGAVYRGGPGFDVEYREMVTDAARPATRILANERFGTMTVPDTFSTGAMFRPRENLMIAIDYTYVDYDALKADYLDMQTFNRPEQFLIESGSEVHGGLEYVFTSAPALPALRLGLWFDPAHAVRYQRTAANDAFDERYAATLRGSEDLVHYTAGIGLALSSRFELNVGADFAPDRTTVASSVILRFR